MNGVFRASDASDPVARALEARGRDALQQLPGGLQGLPRMDVPLLPFGLVGLDALRLLSGADVPVPPIGRVLGGCEHPGLEALVPSLEAGGRGVIFTMGKGGVGKTSVAVSVAVALAGRGHSVQLSTTDPAAHVAEAMGAAVDGVAVSRIDPAVVTAAYRAEVMATAGAALDEAGRALLEEDLRSPCTEEIAVFRAFARTVDQAEQGFVVLDTAPSGHTLLLLDAAESYHREVSKKAGDVPPEVRALLPRLRDPVYTKVLMVTLPEATPVHEAQALQADLERAGIAVTAWVINQSLTPLEVTDPVLVGRRSAESRWLDEVARTGLPVAVSPWRPAPRGQRLELMGVPSGARARPGV